MTLILMSLDPLGGLSLEGTLRVTKRQSKEMKEAAGKGKCWGFTNRPAAAQHAEGQTPSQIFCSTSVKSP